MRRDHLHEPQASEHSLGSEATALAQADRAVPNLGKAELDAQLFKAEVRLNNEVLEDPIERGQLRQTIMQLMAEAIARDVDEVVIQGERGQRGSISLGSSVRG